MTTILYAHPYDKSFNHAILETVMARLDEQQEPYKLIDLYADGFNPSLDAASLALYSRNETADPLAAKYLDILTETDVFIMIFPVWWSTMPAIVDGFFDKVMLGGKAYTYSPSGALIPAKIRIVRTIIFSTSEAPTATFRPFFQEYFNNNVLKTVGMDNLEWYNCDGTSHGPAENRDRFLDMVRTAI